MFQASKQLQEIRKQLKQMDEQYRDGFKADSMENSSDAISKADSNQISASGTQDKVCLGLIIWIQSNWKSILHELLHKHKTVVSSLSLKSKLFDKQTF